MEINSELTVAEVTLRAAAVVALATVALVVAVGLPPVFAEDASLGVVSMGAMALSLWLGWMLAAAPPSAPHLWRLVAATGGVALAGWAATRLFPVPGVAGARGEWRSPEAAAAAVAAAACVVLAALAVPLTRRVVRAAATATVVLAAVGPSAAVTLVAIGPGSAPAASAAGAHQHASLSTDAAIRLRPGSGRDGGHYVVRVATPPHLTAPGIALLSAAAALFAFGAVTSLAQRRRPASAPARGPPQSAAG